MLHRLKKRIMSWLRATEEKTDRKRILGRYGLATIKKKKQLVAWDFASNNIWLGVDSPSEILKVEGKVVLTVTCDDGQLACDWAESWKSWALLQDSTEFKTILDKCKNMLTGGGKGKSKGKPH